MLVLLVMMYLALCSLLASPGPRCSASRPVWSRRTARLVLLVTVYLVLSFLLYLQAQDASHHDRFGPCGLFRHVQGLVCWYLTMSLALCSSWLSQAGMDHRTVWRFTGAVLGQGFLHARCVLCVVSWSRQYSTLFGGSAVAVHHGRRHSLTMRSGSSPWSSLQLIIEIPQFVFGGRCPCLLVFHRCSRGWTVGISQLQPVDARTWCAGLKFHRCGLWEDSRDSTVAASRRICSTLTRWSMSRLWFACLLLFSDRCRDGRWVFLGPCTQVHGQGSPTIRVGKGWRGRRELAPRCSATQFGALSARAWTDTPCSESSVPHTPHTTHHTTRRQRQRDTETETEKEETRQDKTRQDKKREDETIKEKRREDERGETRR